MILQANALLKMFPDFDKATKESVAAIAAKLESLSPEMVRKICNPVSGIATRQAFAPTVFHITEFVAEITKSNFPGFGLRGQLAREVDPEPYHPEIVPYISNRDTRNPEHYAAAKVEDAKTREGIRKAERMLAYVKELGNGIALDGWLIAIERGEEEPPADWKGV